MKAYLIQILLPLCDNHGKIFPERLFNKTRLELMKKFKGLTAYARSPAKGLWKSRKNRVVRDDVILYEVMTSKIERKWWDHYQIELRSRFAQDAVVIRANSIIVL